MKLIVGLGNPGEKYADTRHNAGFLFLDYWVNQQGENWSKDSKLEAEIAKFNDYIICKPQTYMNDSGRSVRKVMDYFKLNTDDLVLIYDDLDVSFGEYKISEGKGPRIHNGVNSVMSNVSSDQFLHVRLGTGGEWFEEYKKKMNSVADDYILKDFNKDQKKGLELIFEKVLVNLKKWIEQNEN